MTIKYLRRLKDFYASMLFASGLYLIASPLAFSVLGLSPKLAVCLLASLVVTPATLSYFWILLIKYRINKIEVRNYLNGTKGI
jgi:hypothetical protein